MFFDIELLASELVSVPSPEPEPARTFPHSQTLQVTLC